MRLFRDSVTMVEIEVFSYCNRRCWFCPNAVVDRFGAKEYMPEALYLRIVEQLAEIDYRGTISYSRYNEPLADRIILRRLEQARRRLPGATLHTNTNGDYLTRAYLDDLVAAGLNSLNIQIYLGNNDRYDHERMRKRLEHIIARLDLAAVVTIDDPDRWLEARADWPGLRLRLYARNFEVNGCSRGDSVPIQLSTPRTSPCLSPFHHLYVDYNGKVMPCCNLRSDVASHENAVIADLSDTPDIFSVYAGATLAAWRRSLIGFGPKHGHCAGCSFVTYEDVPANRLAQDRLLATATPGEGSA
jgi:MoaA/NifB/PqqE/SkfB family radical SAM enzyme